MHLTGYSPHNLNYLSAGDVQQNETVDKHRFEAWKVCTVLFLAET